VLFLDIESQTLLFANFYLWRRKVFAFKKNWGKEGIAACSLLCSPSYFRFKSGSFKEILKQQRELAAAVAAEKKTS
jgi:hypothetical protein